MLHQRLSIIGSNDAAANVLTVQFYNIAYRRSLINVLHKAQVANDNHYSITLPVVRKSHLGLSLRRSLRNFYRGLPITEAREHLYVIRTPRPA